MAKHPTFFNCDTSVKYSSTLFWNPSLGKRALMEIITSWMELKALLDSSGKPASFVCVVTQFEQFFHVELPQPYKIRLEILARKLKCTDFIDRMRHALIEKSEK